MRIRRFPDSRRRRRRPHSLAHHIHTGRSNMNCSNIGRFMGIGALMTIGLGASAAQPPDTVASDVNENTAMGTSALLSLTSGSQNTAAGFGALENNTNGTGNTALGTVAL